MNKLFTVSFITGYLLACLIQFNKITIKQSNNKIDKFGLDVPLKLD
jgi:hypothetical protein